MNNDDSNADADPHAIYSFWPLRDALVWKQAILGVGRRYASSGHHDHDIAKEQHLHRPPPPGVRMSHYCCGHRGESYQRRDRIPYTYTFLVVQRSVCGSQLFKSLCSAGVVFHNLSIRTLSNNLAYISLGDNGEQEGAADTVPSISLSKALSLVQSWSCKEQHVTWTLLNMGFGLSVDVEKNSSSGGGASSSSSSSSSSSTSRSKTTVDFYLASPEQQEACVSTFAGITGRVISRPVLVPPQGLQPGQPVNAHGGGPGAPPHLGGLGGGGYPMPPPPWAHDDDPEDDSQQSRSKVQEEPAPLSHQIVMVAACLNFSLVEITHIHRLVSAFPPRMLPYLPYLLNCRIQHTHRFSPPNYHRLALAIVHSELLVSPRLSPDITLLVACPQTCSFRSLVRQPPTDTTPPCDGQHQLTIHSMVLRNLPWLEDQASELQAQRVFQRPTEAGPASSPSLQIDCQPFALETCEFLIHYARYGSCPLDQLSLGTMGPTSVGSVIHLATHWDVVAVLNVCEHFITSCLEKEISTFSVLQLFDFLTQQGLDTGWELCLEYLVANFERCCQEVAPDVQHLGYGIKTRRKGLDEFVASPIAIAFINSRRLQCFPRQPRLTTDNLGLLVFRNVVQDVEEIKSKPLPGVDVFFACFDRRGEVGHVSDRMLPRPVYARLWGPVLMGTAWEGQEIFIRLQCSREYPIQQPRVEVVPPIFHPIIDNEGCVFPDAISAPGSAREASQILPTIRVVLERLTAPDVGPFGQPLANLQHSVNPEAVRVLMEHGLAAYVLEAQQRQALAVAQMAQQVEAWYARLGDRLLPEEKTMVEQALKTGQHLLYALKCVEHYNNEEAVVDSMEAENA